MDPAAAWWCGWVLDHLPRVLTLARRQGGVFTWRQADELGVSRDVLAAALGAGIVERRAQGVFAVTGAPAPWEQRVRVAVLAAAPRGAAARVTALRMHGLIGGEPPVHVVVPYGCEVRRRDGFHLHRSRTFTAGDVEQLDGLAVTDVARSLIESWRHLDPARWRQLTARALREGGVQRADLLDRLEVMGRVVGAGRMRDLLAERPVALDRARSAGEERLLDLLVSAGFERVVLNFEILDASGALVAEIDAAVPDLRVGFELDSRVWHSLPGQVVKDEIEDLNLSAAGWRIHRVPLRLVLDQPRHATRLLRAIRLRATAHPPEA